MGDKVPSLVIRSAGTKFQVIETATGLIWRTLDTRPEATNWVTLAEAAKK